MGRCRNVLETAVDALRSQGIHAIGFEGDVRKQEDARRVVESTISHFARLDILVNGAAGNFLASAEDLSTNGFKTVLDIDSVGIYTICHEALKCLKKGGSGKDQSSGGLILNISATLHYTAAWYQIHVSATKAAVDSITRSLASEWCTDYDIRINGIAPGPIEGTPGMQLKQKRQRTKCKIMHLFIDSARNGILQWLLPTWLLMQYSSVPFLASRGNLYLFYAGIFEDPTMFRRARSD